MTREPELRMIAQGREAEIFAWEGGTVLRLLRSPEAGEQVDHEAAAMEAARSCGVPVPAVQGTKTVQGRPGLIMERVDGEDLLTLLSKRPWLLFRMARFLGEVHAQLHEVGAPETLRSLRPALREVLGSSDRVPAHLAQLARGALEDLPDGEILCHGDYHPANLIMAGGRPVLIDWTNVTRGHPAADVARTLLLLRLGEPPPGTPLIARALAMVGRKIALSGYLRSYRRSRPLDMSLVARWEVPLAAHRLTEVIESERLALLRILEEQRAGG